VRIGGIRVAQPRGVKLDAEIAHQDFDLAALSGLLSRHRRLVGLLALTGAVIAGALAFAARPYYRAEVVVSDVRDRSFGNSSSLASELGGLASLAGVNMTPGALAAQEAAAVLESHHLADEFIKRNDLIPLLLRNTSKPPTLWLASKKFKETVLTIRKDQRKGVTAVSVVWTDAATAARWANGYVALANELIRGRALDESTRNIAYLNDQIANSTSVELRKVMYTLIETETKNLMIAKGRTEYAFEIVDPAIPPELKAGPHRLLNSLVGLLLGFGLGTGIAYVMERIRGRPRRTTGAVQVT